MATPIPVHGTLRGADNVGRSPEFDGKFGRMFSGLPPAQFGKSDDENISSLMELGELMISHADVPENENNPEESKIPAGYTYLGLFINHDITFDPVTSLQR